VSQTGANSQLGGVNHGFWRLAYHVGMAEIVKTEPIAAAASQTATLATNRTAPRQLEPGHQTVMMRLPSLLTLSQYL
jgi:hypothetical protein